MRNLNFKKRKFGKGVKKSKLLIEKFLKIWLLICVLYACGFQGFCISVISFADNIENEEINIDDIIETASSSLDSELEINSRIGIIYDRGSNTIIWGKDENKRTAMASTTKIMTAVVILENAKLTDIVTVSNKAAWTGGSRLGLKKDDKISLKDLLYGLMLRSGNDAAVAIAEHVGGSVEGFADMMNKKADELGLKDTNFVTPHGLDDPEHYTTAKELAILTDYALKKEEFAKVVKTRSYIININGVSNEISNTNELLGVLEGVYGVKTGFTNNAGRCLVTSVDRDGWEIIVIVLRADTKKIRTQDSIKLIEYTYKNYQLVDLEKIVKLKFDEWNKMNLKRIIINKSKNKDLQLEFTNLNNNIIPVKNTDIDNIDIELNGLFYFEAPVEKGTVFGNMKIVLKENVIDIVEIKNTNPIERKNVFNYLFQFLEFY